MVKISLRFFLKGQSRSRYRPSAEAKSTETNVLGDYPILQNARNDVFRRCEVWFNIL